MRNGHCEHQADDNCPPHCETNDSLHALLLLCAHTTFFQPAADSDVINPRLISQDPASSLERSPICCPSGLTTFVLGEIIQSSSRLIFFMTPKAVFASVRLMKRSSLPPSTTTKWAKTLPSGLISLPAQSGSISYVLGDAGVVKRSAVVTPFRRMV